MDHQASHTHDNLFAQVSAGDAVAFRRLLEKYQGNILGLAISYLKSVHKAQDVLQEVFLAIWERRADLSAMENPEGYLFTLARNKIITELRKKKPDELDLVEQMNGFWNMHIAGGSIDEPGIQARVEQKETYTMIQQAVERLPPQQHKVFVLAKREGKSYQEIAAQLGLSRETVKVHMVKALATLRALMEQLHHVIIFFSLFSQKIF